MNNKKNIHNREVELKNVVDCCYLSKLFEDTHNSFYAQSIERMKKMEKQPIKEQEMIKGFDYGFFLGNQQTILMILSTLLTEDRLCEKCAKFIEEIEDPQMKEMALEFIRNYKLQEEKK